MGILKTNQDNILENLYRIKAINLILFKKTIINICLILIIFHFFHLILI